MSVLGALRRRAQHQRLRSAVERVAAREQGRLLVVTPLGLRGSPHDPERLDSVTLTDDGLRVDVGSASYVLTAPVLVEAAAHHVRLGAERLRAVLTAHGSSGRVDEHAWADAELVLTWDPGVVDRVRRTTGTRLT